MAKSDRISIRKIGLASRDIGEEGLHDFSSYFSEILMAFDKNKCQVALFALFTIDTHIIKPKSQLLENPQHLRMVILETFQTKKRKYKEVKNCIVFIYRSGEWHKEVFTQAFGRINWQVKESSDEERAGVKTVEAFLSGSLTNKRQISDNTCLFICGEINAVKFRKANKIAGTEQGIDDIMGVKKILDNAGIRIIFNPGHDQMTRHEMPQKRAYLSEDERWVISIWNKDMDKIKVGKFGWQIWYDGNDKTHEVQMLEPSTCDWSEKVSVGLLSMS